jgi:hypothetical protein
MCSFGRYVNMCIFKSVGRYFMNKTEETSILQRFRKNYSDFPVGEITQPNNPDFMVQSDSVLGIEITQLFKDQFSSTGSSLREKEVFKRNVLDNIVSLLNTSTFPKCVLSIEFNDSLFTKKLDPRALALKCFDSIISETVHFANEGPYEVENLGALPDIIESYSVFINNNIESTEYVETAGTTLPRLTNEYVQYILDKKEKAKTRYSYCDLYWLIIKEGSFEADSFSEIQIDKSQLKTSFDKVFVIRQSKSEIIELK